MKLAGEIGYWILVAIFVGAIVDAASVWLECTNPSVDWFVIGLLLTVPTYGLGAAVVGAAAAAIVTRQRPDLKLSMYMRFGWPIVLALMALAAAILVNIKELGVRTNCGLF